MSDKRKKLLKELATNIGTIDICPYCNAELDKIPKRKSKCKSCKANIFPRKEPLSDKPKLYREGDLFLLEELKALKDGWWKDWLSENQAVLKARTDLAKEWETDEVKIPIADAKWRSLNTEIMKGSEKGDWNKVFYAYTSMLRQLQCEKRQDASPLNEIVAGFMFTAYGRKQEYMKHRIGRPQFMLIEQLSTDVDKVYSMIKDSHSAKSYSNLMNVTIEEIFNRYKKELNDEATIINDFDPDYRISETIVELNVNNKTAPPNATNESKSNSLKLFITLMIVVGIALFTFT